MANYRENVLAMRTCLERAEELEMKRDTFPVGSSFWLDYDDMITGYMAVWGNRYDWFLNYPKWMWT